VDKTGKAVCKPQEIRVVDTQMRKAVEKVERRFGGNVLFALEGTSSYGQTFSNLIRDYGFSVIEVKPPKTSSRDQNGKTDAIDALEAARTALRTDINKVINPRYGQMCRALRTLVAIRRSITCQQTKNKNALMALLRCNELGFDARGALKPVDYITISRWKERESDDWSMKLVRSEVKKLAVKIVDANTELNENKKMMCKVVTQYAPTLLEQVGIGPVTASEILYAYSYKGRVHSADAFAKLAGTTPIPASSGNVTRYRLSRRGDRHLNWAINVIVMYRMRSDEKTREYVKKRTKEGKSLREIRRMLKKYIAKSNFVHLEKLNLTAVI
jgi:transposase